MTRDPIKPENDIEGKWESPAVRQKINDEAQKRKQHNVFQNEKIDKKRNRDNDER